MALCVLYASRGPSRFGAFLHGLSQFRASERPLPLGPPPIVRESFFASGLTSDRINRRDRARTLSTNAQFALHRATGISGAATDRPT